ncbi:hypothetical protein ACOMHN_062534 [Nucella lapillus]
MSAAVTTLPGQDTFPGSSFVGKKVADNSPPPSPGHTSSIIAYSLGTRPSEPDSKASVAEEVALAMGIPHIVVETVKAFHILEHGTDFTDASEFYAAAENLIKHPEEQTRIAKLLEDEQTKKVIQSKDLVANMVKEAQSGVNSSQDEAHLREKVKQLAEENRRLKKRKICRACRKVDLASSGITFLPCGHFLTCETCSERFDDCPACGKSIMGTVRTFLS